MYEKTQAVAEQLLFFIMRLKEMNIDSAQAQQIHNIETTIYSVLKAIKSIKNIRSNLIDMKESVDPVIT
jgi:hypothetical protein